MTLKINRVPTLFISYIIFSRYVDTTKSLFTTSSLEYHRMHISIVTLIHLYITSVTYYENIIRKYFVTSIVCTEIDMVEIESITFIGKIYVLNKAQNQLTV